MDIPDRRDHVLAYDICATCDAAHEGLLALIAAGIREKGQPKKAPAT